MSTSRRSVIDAYHGATTVGHPWDNRLLAHLTGVFEQYVGGRLAGADQAPGKVRTRPLSPLVSEPLPPPASWPVAHSDPDSDQHRQSAALDRHPIIVDDLSVWRGRHEVLKQVSLTIEAGSITAIVGPSGAGKTTLVSALNGLIRPTAGRILIGGLGALDDPALLQRHRRRTATVFQEHALIDRLSALDNVLLGMADLRSALSPLPWPQTLQRRAAEALLEVGLLHRANTRAANLSGGERQRVGIARALVRRPSLLLGDEPFSAVDPALTTMLGDEFRCLVTANGITVVLVLHQIDVARRLADRLIGLAAGRVAYDGTVAGFDGHRQAKLFPPPSKTSDAKRLSPANQ